MRTDIKTRVLEEAKYILQTGETIRETAKKFHVSKSTVHKDLQEKLKQLNKNIYKRIVIILNYHITIRHIRGGQSTKNKYLKQKNNVVNGSVNMF